MNRKNVFRHFGFTLLCQQKNKRIIKNIFFCQCLDIKSEISIYIQIKNILLFFVICMRFVYYVVFSKEMKKIYMYIPNKHKNRSQ